MNAELSSHTLATLLLPELEAELGRTRRVLERLPESEGEFRLHARSRSLASLAGHTADLVSFMLAVLTLTEFDFGTEHRSSLVLGTTVDLLGLFDRDAAHLLEALRSASDERLLEEFRFLFNGRVVFSGTRYTAYRVNTLNHMIHHRAQLGYYLRARDLKVPALYGPSADEMPR